MGVIGIVALLVGILIVRRERSKLVEKLQAMQNH